MKTKTVGTLLIAGLVVLSAMVVFAGTAAATVNFYKFAGTITDEGVGVEKVWVEIKNTDTGMQWKDCTNSAGYYNTKRYKFCSPSKMSGYYELWVGGDLVAGQSLTADDFMLLYGYSGRRFHVNFWSCDWSVDLIPEFSTIAIPVASILGLLFFFNHRKRREEE